MKIFLLITFLLISFAANAAFQGYPKDSRRYDISMSTKVVIGVQNEEGIVSMVDHISVPTEAGGYKVVTLEHIDKAIEKCQQVVLYETKTRFIFWTEVKAKALELGVQ